MLTKEITTTYDACAVIEGFADYTPNDYDLLEAWSYLIKTGHCWTLQGFYGRGAMNLIEEGIISKDGEVDWSVVPL